MDLRVVFETMDNATNFGSSKTGQELERTQMQILQLLLDSARGVPGSKIHKYVSVWWQ